MNQLQQFEFEFQTNTIRAIADENGNPWFCAKDVADTLGYSATEAMTRKLDDDEKGTTICRTLGGMQELTIINESGLYSVILTSQKPEAKFFKRWVTHEVLPAIRKTGAYINQDRLADPFSTLPTGKTPFDLINANKLHELNKMSPALGQCYLLECGITPDFIKATLGKVGLTVQSILLNKPDPTETSRQLAAAFVADWQGQRISAPFHACLGYQALALFKYWLRLNNVSRRFKDETLLDDLFSQPGYSRRINYTAPDNRRRQKTKNQMLIVPGEHRPTSDNAFIDWQAGNIRSMSETLRQLGIG